MNDWLRDLRNGLAFALGFFLALTWGLSYAAVTVKPVLSRFSTGTDGNYASSPEAVFNSGMMGYSQPASVAVSGKTIPLVSKFPLAAGAASIAKNAMRTNPYVLAGSLALPWLLDKGFEADPVTGEWTKADPSAGTYPDGVAWACWAQVTVCESTVCHTSNGGCSVEEALKRQAAANWGTNEPLTGTVTSRTYLADNNISGVVSFVAAGTSRTLTVTAVRTANLREATRLPVSDSDWDNLPDPLSTVGPELPTAPYMPNGAPVGTPTFDPQTVSTGPPFKMPDGSTVQPKATVTDAGGGNVTVVTYNVTTINSAGQPVTDAPPVPTPAEDQQDLCEAHPDILACGQLGEAPSVDLGSEVRDIPLITPVTVGGAGSCPAPIAASFMGQPLSFSFDLPCQAADMLRPLILALAWLSAGLIFIQGVRQ